MLRMSQIMANKWAGAATAAILSFSVYLTTLCPTVSFTDAGELSAVASFLGIAHPTGYPLFTLLGRCAVMLPFGGEEIAKLNILAAFYTAISAGMIFILFRTLATSRGVFPWRRRLVLTEEGLNSVAFVSSLVFSLTSTIWSQSTGVEVYSLHVLLILLASLVFTKGLEEQHSERRYTSRYLLAFGFVLGLSFSNHMTTILLAPAFLYLYFAVLGFDRNSFVRLGKITPFFLLGLSLYIYLPVRSTARPLLDWGNPVTIERFLWHVSGKQYQVWMFEGWDIAKKQLSHFLQNLSSELNWLAFLVLVVGCFSVIITRKRLAVFLALQLITCVVYAINYEIHDINSYFILAYVALCTGIFFGMQYILEFVRSRKTIVVLYFVFLFIPVLQLMNNRKLVDESENYLAEDATMTILDNVEPNSVVFTSLWDYFVSPMCYFQNVKRLRRDVVVVDKSLLQNRSWYFTQLERNHPWLFDRCREELSSFLAELSKFEKGEPFNFMVIQAKWSALLNQMVQKSLVDHNVYIDGRILGEFSGELPKIPFGLLYMVKMGNNLSMESRPKLEIRKITYQSPVSDDFRQYWAFMLTQNAYASQFKEKGFSIQLLDKALELQPDYAPALGLKSALLR